MICFVLIIQSPGLRARFFDISSLLMTYIIQSILTCRFSSEPSYSNTFLYWNRGGNTKANLTFPLGFKYVKIYRVYEECILKLIFDNNPLKGLLLVFLLGTHVRDMRKLEVGNCHDWETSHPILSTDSCGKSSMWR